MSELLTRRGLLQGMAGLVGAAGFITFSGDKAPLVWTPEQSVATAPIVGPGSYLELRLTERPSRGDLYRGPFMIQHIQQDHKYLYVSPDIPVVMGSRMRLHNIKVTIEAS